jgi:hypothetical protein
MGVGGQHAHGGLGTVVGFSRSRSFPGNNGFDAKAEFGLLDGGLFNISNKYGDGVGGNPLVSMGFRDASGVNPLKAGDPLFSDPFGRCNQLFA